MKAMVGEILEETGFKEQRVGKTNVNDLFKYDSVSRASGFTDIRCALPGHPQHFMM